jgi:hypothetical protein
MTDEDTAVKATQFRGSDEALAGSFHKDHVSIAYDRTPEPRRGSQITKRDEGTPRIVPRIVVAEQWLCFLFGLICMICGVCGLFMKYNQDSPFACIRWLTDITSHRNRMRCRGRNSGSLRAGGPAPSVALYRSKAVAISLRKLSACFESIFCLVADFGLRIEVERKGPL